MIEDTQFRSLADGAAVRFPSREEASPVKAPAVILICPDEGHRRGLVQALAAERATLAQDFKNYPTPAQFPALLEAACDAIIVEIDTNHDVALELIEALCGRRPSATVMAYSEKQDPQLLVRCMRSGAREYLTAPQLSATLGEALVRASARRGESGEKGLAGRVFVFWGAKGGAGTTTVASNFAVALRGESGTGVALVDLNPNLGEIAIHLGLEPRFTLADAMRNAARLDQEFVATLLSEHRSGVSVLSAPDVYTSSSCISDEPLRKLLLLLRAQFPYTVIDAGRSFGESAETMFRAADNIYVVAQLDVPSLRNAQRFVAYARAAGFEHLELVLNRFDLRKTDFDEARLSKTVGLAPTWKVPNNYPAVRNALNAGNPLVTDNSALARCLHQMARRACGKPEPEKKKGFRLFG